MKGQLEDTQCYRTCSFIWPVYSSNEFIKRVIYILGIQKLRTLSHFSPYYVLIRQSFYYILGIFILFVGWYFDNRLCIREINTNTNAWITDDSIYHHSPLSDIACLRKLQQKYICEPNLVTSLPWKCRVWRLMRSLNLFGKGVGTLSLCVNRVGGLTGDLGVQFW